MEHENPKEGTVSNAAQSVDSRDTTENDSALDMPVSTKKGRLFICKECNRLYSTSYNLSEHMRERHGRFLDNRNSSTLVCSLCLKELLSKISYERHLLKEHEISLEKEHLTFESEEEFRVWKDDIEKQTACLFSKNTGAHRVHRTKFSYYYCHWSGKARDVADDKRQRHLKDLRPSKRNKTCPAMIKVREMDNSIEVDFFKTHVGHPIKSFSTLKLSDEEKKDKANKLVGETPAKSVLNEFQDSGENRLEKVHLMTRAEIAFVRAEFKTYIESQNPDAEDSINTWVSNMQDDENSPIIFFKPQNVCSDIFSGLSKNDFMLIIMNNSQRAKLIKHGNDVLCIDFEQGSCNYPYYLTSLLVLDSKKKAVPGAFIISNRHDSVALTIAFDSIKEQGVDIRPQIFLSNNSECILDAWDFVFGLPKKYFFCSWDADDSWRKKLNRMVPKDVQPKIYPKLHALLIETDVETFEMLLSTTVRNLLDDPFTERFGEHFEKEFAAKPESWAYCYRKWSEMDTNMHMESMHKTLRYLFLEGKYMCRIDKTVYFLCKFIKDKVFENLMHKEKIAVKKIAIAACHNSSLSLSEDLLCQRGDKWLVVSQSKTSETYYIKEGEPCSSDCELLCDPCGCCWHRFVCTCDDYVVKKNMCKHIHLLCRTFNSSENSPSQELNSSSIVEPPESMSGRSSSVLNSHNVISSDAVHCEDVEFNLSINEKSDNNLDDSEETISLDGLEQSPGKSEPLEDIKKSVLDLYRNIGKSIQDCRTISDYRALQKVMEVALKSFQNYKCTEKRKNKFRDSQKKCKLKRVKL